MFRFGTCPTGIFVTTLCEATSITVTQFDPAQATYIDLLSGVNVNQSGSSPTGTLASSFRSGIEYSNT